MVEHFERKTINEKKFLDIDDQMLEQLVANFKQSKKVPGDPAWHIDLVIRNLNERIRKDPRQQKKLEEFEKQAAKTHAETVREKIASALANPDYHPEIAADELIKVYMLKALSARAHLGTLRNLEAEWTKAKIHLAAKNLRALSKLFRQGIYFRDHSNPLGCFEDLIEKIKIAKEKGDLKEISDDELAEYEHQAEALRPQMALREAQSIIARLEQWQQAKPPLSLAEKVEQTIQALHKEIEALKESEEDSAEVEIEKKEKNIQLLRRLERELKERISQHSVRFDIVDQLEMLQISLKEASQGPAEVKAKAKEFEERVKNSMSDLFGKALDQDRANIERVADIDNVSARLKDVEKLLVAAHTCEIDASTLQGLEEKVRELKKTIWPKAFDRSLKVLEKDFWEKRFPHFQSALQEAKEDVESTAYKEIEEKVRTCFYPLAIARTDELVEKFQTGTLLIGTTIPFQDLQKYLAVAKKFHSAQVDPTGLDEKLASISTSTLLKYIDKIFDYLINLKKNIGSAWENKAVKIIRSNLSQEIAAIGDYLSQDPEALTEEKKSEIAKKLAELKPSETESQ